MTTTDPLTRLTALAEQRRVKTATLHAAVQRFLSALPDSVRRLAADGVVLERIDYVDNRTIYGHGWSLSGTARGLCHGTEASGGDLTQPVGSEGYLRGQFGCPFAGPTRGDLLLVAAYARRLTVACADALEEQCASLDAATEALGGAAEVES